MQEDEAPRMGASLAYCALFSLAPLLVIVIAIVGFVYEGDTVVQIQRQVQSLVGADAAKTIYRRSNTQCRRIRSRNHCHLREFCGSQSRRHWRLQRTSHGDEQDLEGPTPQ